MIKYDKRLATPVLSQITDKERARYIKALPCSLCGKQGGKCGCKKK